MLDGNERGSRQICHDSRYASQTRLVRVGTNLACIGEIVIVCEMEWKSKHIKSIQHLQPKQRGNVEIDYLSFFQALHSIATDVNGEPCLKSLATGIVFTTVFATGSTAACSTAACSTASRKIFNREPLLSKRLKQLH